MQANELPVEALLRAHAPSAPESLRQRVLELDPKRESAWTPRRRLVLVALPAAIALALTAAVVRGLVDSGNPTSTPTVAIDRVPAPQVELAPGRTQATAPQDSATGALKAAAPATAGTSRLQHTDASIRIRVDDTDTLSKATTRATRIATSLGGYAQSVDYQTPQDGGGSAYLELRVPSQNVKKALAQLAGLGTLVSQELSVQDLEQRLQTQSEQVTQLRSRVAALREALKDASLPEAQRVLLQIRLAETKRALAQRINARKGTITSGATAHISLVIGTEKAIVVPHERSRAERVLRSAVAFLALEAIVVLYALIVVSPLALVLGLIWLRRRRAVDRLLAA
jgi:Domain of unknown function (DUF4349)